MNDFFEEQLEPTESVDFMRYIRGLLRRWWLVALVAVGVLIPWLIYVKQIKPVYQAEVWVSFDNMAGSVPESLLESRKRKLKSRTFAAEACSKLGLSVRQLRLNSLLVTDRSEVFTHVATQQNPQPVSGIYRLVSNAAGHVTFSRGDSLIEEYSITTLTRDTVAYAGLTFRLNPDLSEEPFVVEFYIEDLQRTVSSLISRENVFFNGPGTLMRVTLTDENPRLASQTVNLLAEKFVQEILNMQRNSNSFNRELIEEKLMLAEDELNESDLELKMFRNTHLRGLDQETQQIVNNLDQNEKLIERMQSEKAELRMLLDKLNPESSDFGEGVSTGYVYREIANLGMFDQSSNMTIVRQELRDLSSQRAGLLGNGRPETYPEVIELSDRISSLEIKVVQIAKAKLVDLDKEIQRLADQSDSLQRKLNLLPEEEIKLMKLSRQRRANEDLHQMLLRKHKEAELAEAVALSNVSIIDPAVPPTQPMNGSKRNMALLGLLISIGLGVGVALVLELTDKSIRSREDVSRFIKLPLLGVIPKVKFDDYELQDSEKAKSISSQIVTHDYSPTPVGEAYRVLRTNILFSKDMGETRSLVISSMAPGEGKSFTSANLAITLAQQKSNTLLVDADLRRGVLHNTFNCSKKPGLTNYLTGVAPLGSVLHETYIPNLSIITCGSMIPNPSEILGSLRMQKFIEGITKRFDFVIFDTPPLNAATDAVVLGTLVDGVAVVVRSGRTNGVEIKRRLELFQNVQAKMAGVILNGAGVEVAHEGYSYYQY